MFEYATKICPIFATSNAYRGLNVRAIIEAYNAMAQNQIVTDRLTVGKFVGLPAAVLAFYSEQFGKTGHETVRKGRQLLQIGSVRGKFGNQITQKIGFRGLILSGCWYTIKQVGFGPVLVFPFGLAFDAADMSQSDMRSAMIAAIDWLPVKPGIEIKEIAIK